LPPVMPEPFRGLCEGLVWVYRPEIGKRQHHNLRAVQLAKDAHSMEPTIRSGDIVIVDPEDRKINPKAIYAVRLDSEGGCAIKRVRVSDNYVVLFSDNRDPIYGPVVLTKTGRKPHHRKGDLVLDQLGEVRRRERCDTMGGGNRAFNTNCLLSILT